MKVWVFGAPGSGKTTLAKALSHHLNAPHFELDSLFWSPGWRIRPESEFLRDVDELSSRVSWVFDGNYTSAEPFLRRADIAFWVDLPFTTTYPRVLKRSIKDAWHGNELFSGNVETLRRILSKDGMPSYALLRHRRNYERFSKFYKNFPNQKSRLANAKDVLQDALRLCDEMQ